HPARFNFGRFDPQHTFLCSPVNVPRRIIDDVLQVSSLRADDATDRFHGEPGIQELLQTLRGLVPRRRVRSPRLRRRISFPLPHGPVHTAVKAPALTAEPGPRVHVRCHSSPSTLYVTF